MLVDADDLDRTSRRSRTSLLNFYDFIPRGTVTDRFLHFFPSCIFLFTLAWSNNPKTTNPISTNKRTHLIARTPHTPFAPFGSTALKTRLRSFLIDFVSYHDIGNVIFACHKVNLPDNLQADSFDSEAPTTTSIRDTTGNHTGPVTIASTSVIPVPQRSFPDHNLDPALYSSTAQPKSADRPAIAGSSRTGASEPHYSHMSTAVAPNSGPLSQTPSSMPVSSPHYAPNPYPYDPNNPPAAYSDTTNPSFPPNPASMAGHHGQNAYYMNPPHPQYSAAPQYPSRPYEYTSQSQWQSQATPRSAQSYLVGPGEYPAPAEDMYYARQEIPASSEPLPAATEPTVDYVSPTSRRGSSEKRQSPENSTSGSKPKSASNRPSGLQHCTSCDATTSPEWRKGPSGKKELCNA